MLSHEHAARLRRLRSAGRKVGKALTRWLPNSAVEPIRTQAFAFPADEVVKIMSALQAAGVNAWVLGGWGVDALVGTQTRRHSDLDLAVEAVGPAVNRAVEVVVGIGYVSVEASPENSKFMPFRLILRHPTGWTVDLIPVWVGPGPRPVPPDATPAGSDVLRNLSYQEPDRSGDWQTLGAGGHLFVTGSIASCPVPCISADAQLLLRQGYQMRRRDHRDRSLLERAVRAAQ